MSVLLRFAFAQFSNSTVQYFMVDIENAENPKYVKYSVRSIVAKSHSDIN